MGLLHGLQMRLSAPSQQARHCMIHTLSITHPTIFLHD